MFGHMGPIDINCDAPPYPIVKACEKLGFRSSLDVPWCRMSHFMKGQGERVSEPLSWLFGTRHPSQTTCKCSQPLPQMEPYTFTFASKKEAKYLLGQCCHCRSIFWEESPAPAR